MGWAELVADARRGRGLVRHARSLLRGARRIRLPFVRPLAALLYAERDLRQQFWPIVAKILYREPLLRYRCARLGRGLNLYGSLPWIAGQGRIEIGEDVMIGGKNSWIIGFKVSEDAELIIGDRATIGYQNTLSVARSLRIGQDTMLAANVKIYDNPTHPMSPAARLRHESFALEDAQPVVIGDNVWIGTNAMIMRGVTIGNGAIVGAGSVVTKDVRPNTLVAGNPAREVRELED